MSHSNQCLAKVSIYVGKNLTIDIKHDTAPDTIMKKID